MDYMHKISQIRLKHFLSLYCVCFHLSFLSVYGGARALGEQADRLELSLSKPFKQSLYQYHDGLYLLRVMNSSKKVALEWGMQKHCRNESKEKG